MARGPKKGGRPRFSEEETQQFSIRLPLSLYLRLRHLAVDARLSVNEIVFEAVSAFMEKEPDPAALREKVRGRKA